MKLRWFLSGTVRQATDLAKHVRRLLSAQRDILSPQAVEGLTTGLAAMKNALDSNASDEALKNQISELEKTANKWLKPYPNSTLRENVEVLLVAIAVAMAIRTFFLQPFKIPTGSMQPTLYGVTFENLRDKPDYKIPALPGRIFDALVSGTFYHEIIAEADGTVVDLYPPKGFGINKRTFVVQYEDRSQKTPITVWFAPDEDPTRPSAFLTYTGLTPGMPFKKGEPIIRYRETTGDHLFVDRVTYNFRHPKRGEIIVFQTKGIPGLQQNQFYIKRLVGLPGEDVSIGTDRHVRINGKRLDASTPHFEMVYSFDPNAPPQDSHYSGHSLLSNTPGISDWPFVQFFDEPEKGCKVRDGHFMVFGDNTANSLDSRYWGDFSEQNVIGKSWFVYWPITWGQNGRFGWGQK